MTENIENVESSKDERTDEQVEIDRLTAECAVWRDRSERVNKEYARYRMDTRVFTKQADDTIENLNGKIAAQDEHLLMHHQRDEVRAAEMERMEAKLTSYSALLNLMADAGRLPIEMLEHIDAGISAIHDQGIELPMEVADVKFFTGKNPLQQLRDYLAKQMPDDDVIPAHICESENCDDPSHDTEYVTPRDLATEVKADWEREMEETGGVMPEHKPGPGEQRFYVSGPGMDKLSYTDAGLPKRPIKDDPQG